MMGDQCDLVLREGFRASAAPKVLVPPEAANPARELPDGVVTVVLDNKLSGDVWQ